MHTLVPQDGVYAGVATTASGARYGAAIHVGKNLTFSAATKTVEVHLLGFSGDLYGQLLQVEFFQRLRSTEKFEGVDALTKQLHADVAAVESLSQLNLEKPQLNEFRSLQLLFPVKLIRPGFDRYLLFG